MQYIYIYIYTYVHISCMYMCVYTLYTYACIYMHENKYICLRVTSKFWAHEPTHAFTRINTCIYTQTLTNTRTNTKTDIHTYTCVLKSGDLDLRVCDGMHTDQSHTDIHKNINTNGHIQTHTYTFFQVAFLVCEDASTLSTASCVYIHKENKKT